MMLDWMDHPPGPTEPRLRAFMNRRWGAEGRGPLTSAEAHTSYRDLPDLRVTPEQELVLGLRPTRERFDRLLEFGCEDDDALVLLGLELGYLDGHDAEGMLADPALLVGRWLVTGGRALLRALPWVPANEALAAAVRAGLVTDPARLRGLAVHGDNVVGSALAQSPLADPDLLDALVHHHAADDRAAPYPDPLADVIAHRDVSDATLAWLRAFGPRRTRAALIGRRDCPDLGTYAVDPDYVIRVIARLNQSAPDGLARDIAHDPDLRARSLAVESFGTPVDLLVALASDEEPSIRLLVAGKGATPLTALQHLAADPDPGVRARVARRGGLPPEILELIAVDPDPAVRAFVATNPATAPDLLARLAGDPDVSVRVAVGDNRHAPTDALFALAGSPDWEVWQVVAANPTSTPEALERVYRGSRGDPTWSVLVANPRTPRPVLEEIGAHYSRAWSGRVEAALAGRPVPRRATHGEATGAYSSPGGEPASPWLARIIAEADAPDDASTHSFESRVSDRSLGVHGERGPSLDRHLWPGDGSPLPRRQALSPEARLDAILTPEQRRLLDGSEHYVMWIENYPYAPRLRVRYQRVDTAYDASTLLEIDEGTYRRFLPFRGEFIAAAAEDPDLAALLKTWVRDIHQEQPPGLARVVVQGRRAVCDHPAWRREHTHDIRSIIELQTPPCPNCGATAVLIVDADGYELYAQGASIRHAFPALTDEQQERLATGAHCGCPRRQRWGFF